MLKMWFTGIISLTTVKYKFSFSLWKRQSKLLKQVMSISSTFFTIWRKVHSHITRVCFLICIVKMLCNHFQTSINSTIKCMIFKLGDYLRAYYLLNILIWLDDKPVYECLLWLVASFSIDITKRFLISVILLCSASNLNRYEAIF